MAGANRKISIRDDGMQGFVRRARQHAQALDRGETLPAETTVSFVNSVAMSSVFTPMRIVLLETIVADGAMPVNLLARRLKRERSAVARDVKLLRDTGVVETERVINPGHGRVTVVKPLARRYEFVWTVSAERKSSASKKGKARAA